MTDLVISNTTINTFATIYDLEHEYAVYCLEHYSDIIAKAVSGDQEQVKECVTQMKSLREEEAFALFQVIDYSLINLPPKTRLKHTYYILLADYGWDNHSECVNYTTKNRAEFCKRISTTFTTLYQISGAECFEEEYLGFIRHINPVLYAFTKYYEQITTYIEDDKTYKEALSQLRPLFGCLKENVSNISWWLQDICNTHIIDTCNEAGMDIAQEFSGYYTDLNSILIADIAKNN